MATTRRLERVLLGLLLLALIWAPLPLGSNRPWPMALLAIWLGLILLAASLLHCLAAPLPVPAPSPDLSADHRHAVAQARGRRRLFGPQVWPVLLLTAFNLWVAVQLTPWGHTEDAFSTRLYLLRSLACLSGFGCVLLLANSTLRRTWLFGGLLASGVLQALLAIVLFSTQARYVLLGTEFVQGLRATGTFPNPDHLANYMALTLAAGIGLMLGQMGQASSARAAVGSTWRQRLLGFLEFLLSPKMLVRMMLVLMVIAMVLTRSRMGNGAFFLALPILGVVVATRSRQLRRPAAWLVASLLAVDIIVVGQWVGLDKVIKRMEATELVQEAEAASAAAAGAASGVRPPPVHREETLEQRMRAAEDTVHMVQERPLAGWGGGSYYAAFPNFKREGLGLYDHTHSDYVEIAADVGLVGLALLVGVFLLTLRRTWQLLTDEHSPQTRGLAAGVGMAMLCALLHGFVDFTLQIPANSLVLTVLLAAVWAAPRVERRARAADLI